MLTLSSTLRTRLVAVLILASRQICRQTNRQTTELSNADFNTNRCCWSGTGTGTNGTHKKPLAWIDRALSIITSARNQNISLFSTLNANAPNFHNHSPNTKTSLLRSFHQRALLLLAAWSTNTNTNAQSAAAKSSNSYHFQLM